MKIGNIFRYTFGLLAMATILTSCGGVLYEDQGDCDPKYKVRFRFERNLKFTDAFSAEVNAVTLYVVDDATGRIVWSKQENGDNVRSEGYLMDVPVNAGHYHLVAWCGDGVGTDFHVPETDRPEELTCHLKHNTWSRSDDGAFHVDRELNRLYHGRTMHQDFPEDEGTHIYDVDLTKNTNEVNVVLQQLSGEPMDVNKFSFYISDANHILDWTNAKAPGQDESIVYHQHHVSGGSAALEMPEHGVNKLNAIVAELSVSRLLADSECYLSVVNNDTGELVFKVPLIDYVLMVKGSVGRNLEDQEYLDRQDKYDLIFFLDEGYRWMNAYIYINSWKVVLQQGDL